MAASSKIIHVWSGPRSLSTSTMYSFAQRSDTTVLDEPLYASWLHRNPHVFRPYREELLKVQKVDGTEVIRQISSMKEKPVIFCKHVAKQFVGLDKSLLVHEGAIHVFLVRNPLELIPAWDRKNSVHQELCSLETIGLPAMCEMYSYLRQHLVPTIVVDANLLKAHPKEILSNLCILLGLEFEESQLSWPAGPKPDIDG